MLLFSLKRVIHQSLFVPRNTSIIRFSSRFYSTESSPPKKSWKIEQPSLNLHEFISYCNKQWERQDKSDFNKVLKNLSKEEFIKIQEKEAFTISKTIVRLFNENIPIDTIKNFEEAVVKNLKNYENESQDISICLSDIMKMHKWAFIPANTDFENDYLDYLEKTHKPTQVAFKLYAITNLIQKPQNVDKYKAIYESLAKIINSTHLRVLHDNYLSTLLKAFSLSYSYLNQNASFKMETGEDLFEEIEEIILYRIGKKTFKYQHIIGCFQALNSINKASESFIMAFSEYIQTNISHLEEQSFVDTYLIAGNIKLDECSQLISIHKILYENLLERFHCLKWKNLRKIFFSLSKESYYVDERLDKAIKEYIEGNEFLSLETNYKIDRAIIFINFMWNTLENYDVELLEKLKKICCDNFSELDKKNKLRIAAFFSTSKDLSENFWRNFIDEVNVFLEDNSNYNHLYAIDWNLSGTPFYDEYHQKIQQIYQQAEQSWKTARDKDKLLTNWTHTHEIVSNYLLSANIDFTKDYFYRIYFDFAIPQTKKLIKISNISNYTLPTKFLKRYSDNNITFRNQKEWNLINIPTFDISDQEVKEKVQKFLDLR